MTDTANLSLPLLQAAQAQKHVTMNEALLRLDALVHLRLRSVDLGAPPTDAEDGAAWAVPSGANGQWLGHEGSIAIRDGGGWVFAKPQIGWRAWVDDLAYEARHDGRDWIKDAAAASASGAALRFEVWEFDHPIVPGGAQAATTAIPSHAMVFGVTARVISEITGTLTSWRLGVQSSDNRFGDGLGLNLNSYAKGVLGTPLTGYEDMYLQLSPEDGEFAGGAVRLAVHCAELSLPSAV